MKNSLRFGRTFLVSSLAFGMATLSVGCGVKEEIYNAKVAELQKTQAELADSRRQADEARKQAQETQARLDKENLALKLRLRELGQKEESTSADLAEAQKRMDEMKRAQEAAEKRAAQYKQMVSKFKSMMDAGQLKVTTRDGLMLVQLPDNILFDPGKVDLKPAGKEAIAKVAQILAGVEGRKFQVTGHTDNVPIKSHKFKSNWELSAARAVEVVKYMAQNGMDPKRLSAAGYADELPVASNDTEEGRKQNRRIEIVIQPNIEDLPSMDDAGMNKT